MKKILITGGTGFIGSHLVEMLASGGYKVKALSQYNSFNNWGWIEDLECKNHIEVLTGDIRDPYYRKQIMKGTDIIYHLAALIVIPYSYSAPDSYVDTNIKGTLNICQAAKENGNIRVIHTSTSEVYGTARYIPIDENHPLNAQSPYAASKAASDHLVSSYVRTYKIPAMVTNCSNNFGPKQHPEKLIPKLIYNILNNKPLPIYGKGTNSREWIYVKDHCEALIKVYQRGKVGEFYNIGSNKNLNNLEVCKKLLNASKSSINIGKNVKITFVKDRPGHDIRYALNSKKIKQNLNWYPKTNFKDGIKLTFDWYNNNKTYYKSLSKKDITNRLGKK